MTSTRKNAFLFLFLLLAGLFAMLVLPVGVHADTYEITVYITGNGGTVTCGGTQKTSGSVVYADKDTLAAFLIEPDSGYKVDTVKYSGGTLSKSGNLYTTPALTSNTTLYVTFTEVKTLDITFNVGTEGFITSLDGMALYGSQSVTEGESFSFKVSSIDGYGVKSVKYSGNALSCDEEGIYTVTPKSSGILSVTFDRYNTIDFVTGLEGLVTDSSGNIISGETIEVVEGMSFNFLVECSDGYGVKSVTVAYDTLIRKLSPNTDGSYTVPATDSACIVYIDFQQVCTLDVIAPPKDCSLTVKNGNETLKTGKSELLKGSSIVVTASEEKGTGYIFDKFNVTTPSGEQEVTEPSVTIILDGDITVEPVYKKVDTFNISIISSGSGTISQSGGYSPNEQNVRVNSGDRVTFTITPTAECRLESIVYSGASLTQDGETYITDSISSNQTLEVVFSGKSDSITGVEVTDIGTVVSVKSLADIAGVIDDNNGNILRAPSGDGILPSDALYKLVGKNIWLDITGEGYSWNINSVNIIGSAFTPADLNLSLKDEYAPVSLYQLRSYPEQKQLHIMNEGAMQFTATLNVDMNAKNAGKTATLFSVDRTNNTVTAISSSSIAEDGNASFVFDKGGYYVIVTSDAPITNEILSAAVNQGTVDTGGKQLVLAVCLVAILLAIGGIIVYSMTKMNSNK